MRKHIFNSHLIAVSSIISKSILFLIFLIIHLCSLYNLWLFLQEIISLFCCLYLFPKILNRCSRLLFYSIFLFSSSFQNRFSLPRDSWTVLWEAGPEFALLITILPKEKNTICCALIILSLRYTIFHGQKLTLLPSKTIFTRLLSSSKS